METARTPDERFAKLPGYPFAPHYTDVPDGDGGSLRIHCVDEGPADGPVVLCMHGEPTWSYLYRKMIPVFCEAGLRAVAPDLVGFGRSDKPVHKSDYTYARHVAWITAWLERCDLRDITLVCQDWGGLVGLRVAAENPDRFARLVIANTGLPEGGHPGEAFLGWLKFSQEVPEFPVGAIVSGACDGLPAEIVAAYDAPFPEERFKAGARVFPTLVPVSPEDPAVLANRRAWKVLERWEKPVLCAFSDGDPITRGWEKGFRERIPGAGGQPHTTITGAGHFLQEQQGEAFARVVVDFVNATR